MKLSKVELKKHKKREALLKSAYTLFTTTGFAKTTILDIALKAGVAKGTFYLYFDSKEDIRDELTIIKASEVLDKAWRDLEEKYKAAVEDVPVADRFIYIVDYILEYLSKDLTLCKFISKNLSWGLFFDPKHSAPDSDIVNVKDFVIKMIEEDGIKLKEPELLFFTIIELTNSTCYSVIVNNDPVSLEQFKPYLYHSIRLLVNDALME